MERLTMIGLPISAAVLALSMACTLGLEGIFVNTTEESVTVIVAPVDLTGQAPREWDRFTLQAGASHRTDVGSLVTLRVEFATNSFRCIGPWPDGYYEPSKYKKGGRTKLLVARDGVYAVPRKLWRTWPEKLEEVLVPENKLQTKILERPAEPEP